MLKANYFDILHTKLLAELEHNLENHFPGGKLGWFLLITMLLHLFLFLSFGSPVAQLSNENSDPSVHAQMPSKGEYPPIHGNLLFDGKRAKIKSFSFLE